MKHAVDHWRLQFRGTARVKDDKDITQADIDAHNLILWGDPSSNAILAKVVGKLPLGWNKDRIQLGDRSFDAGHHVPVLIYPNPLNPKRYVVLNSGFTFREYDYLNNARQVPKLPDFAVVDIDVPASSRSPGGIVTAGFSPRPGTAHRQVIQLCVRDGFGVTMGFTFGLMPGLCSSRVQHSVGFATICGQFVVARIVMEVGLALLEQLLCLGLPSLVFARHREEIEVDGATGFMELDRLFQRLRSKLPILRRKAATPSVFQNVQSSGLSSTAFLAESRATVIENGVDSGLLTITHARLLWASAKLGASSVTSRKSSTALNRFWCCSD